MKIQSKKTKGRKGQQEIQKMLLKLFPELEADDCRSNPMGSHGEDILLSPKARKQIPFNIEVKWNKRIAACRFMEQAASHGDYYPLSLFREDRGPWFACLNAEVFFTLLKGNLHD